MNRIRVLSDREKLLVLSGRNIGSPRGGGLCLAKWERRSFVDGELVAPWLESGVRGVEGFEERMVAAGYWGVEGESKGEPKVYRSTVDALRRAEKLLEAHPDELWGFGIFMDYYVPEPLEKYMKFERCVGGSPRGLSRR
jgi:hypothetical protein